VLRNYQVITIIRYNLFTGNFYCSKPRTWSYGKKSNQNQTHGWVKRQRRGLISRHPSATWHTTSLLRWHKNWKQTRYKLSDLRTQKRITIIKSQHPPVTDAPTEVNNPLLPCGLSPCDTIWMNCLKSLHTSRTIECTSGISVAWSAARLSSALLASTRLDSATLQTTLIRRAIPHFDFPYPNRLTQSKLLKIMEMGKWPKLTLWRKRGKRTARSLSGEIRFKRSRI